jgi:hypothetical protein
MNWRRGLSKVLLAVGLLALPACSTEEVAPTSPIVIPSEQSGANMGGAVIQFAPSDPTYQQEQARMSTSEQTEYHVMVDGDYVYEPTVTTLWEVTVFRGGQCERFFLPAGPHHFTIVSPEGAPIFEGDGEIPAGGVERILVYGPLDALQGRFVPVPTVPTSGHQHLTVVNLTSGAESIEVVTCTDATTCTPLASALALGDVLDADLPPFYDDCAPDLNAPTPVLNGCGTSLTTQGAGVGYRVAPSASLPNPPMNPVWPGVASSPRGTYAPGVFIAAPVYLSEQGVVQFSFD